MYTLMMMTALSSAPDAAGFDGYFRDLFFGCHGCNGCQGSCSGCNGCQGSSYASCYGSCHGSCYGCCGGESCFGSRIRAFFQRDSSCYGSCSGHSTGCYGSYSCHGCSGSTASGGVPGAMPGGMPGEYAPPTPASQYVPMTMPSYAYSGPPVFQGSGCRGETLGVPSPAVDAFAYGLFPGTIPPGSIYPIKADAYVPSNEPTDSRNYTPSTRAASSPDRATVIVRLPADAKLYAEGKLLTLTSAERVFVSPPLPVNKDFHYTFRVEYVRDGETITRSRETTVRAGSSVTIDFTDRSALRAPTIDTNPAAPAPMPLGADLTPRLPAPPSMIAPVSNQTSNSKASSERARITVKLPEGATLYVDGKKNPRSEAVREFQTPPIPAGREFAYLMRAEVIRNGRPEFQETKVSFRAGEIVTVDFANWPKSN